MFIVIFGGIIFGLFLFSLMKTIIYILDVLPDLKKMNKLYECRKCSKYHRKYQELIKEKEDSTFRTDNYDNTCPHCSSVNTTKVNEEYKWTRYHADCPYLGSFKYKKFKKLLMKLEKAAYDLRSIEKFKQMNKIN